MGLSPIDLRQFQIDTSIELSQEGMHIPTHLLPKQYIDGSLRVGGLIRCSLINTSIENRGGHGVIYKAKRLYRGEYTDVCIKAPHTPSFSLCPEGVLQWIASESLKAADIIGAVPEIYDIYQYAGETRLCMSYIEGMSSLEKILTSATPDITLLQILAQVSLLLGYLEEIIHLDHRDLKADNIWIRPQPVSYRVKLGGRVWHLSAPFQVVILDFGFSCLGLQGTAIVSLSDGILPRVDPCPKEGRDLFQLIASLWSVPMVRNAMSSDTQEIVEALLSYRNKPYSSLAKHTVEISWVYLLVSDASFRHPPLHPLSLLRFLGIKYGEMYITSE
jgi:serine/threonine protein kinase